MTNCYRCLHSIETGIATGIQTVIFDRHLKPTDRRRFVIYLKCHFHFIEFIRRCKPLSQTNKTKSKILGIQKVQFDSEGNTSKNRRYVFDAEYQKNLTSFMMRGRLLK